MKRLRKLGIVFALLLAVSLAAAFVCIRVKTVTVQGNRIYSEEAARKALLPQAEGERSAELLFRLWRGKKKQLAFLTGYDIRFTSPFSVELILNEKPVLGYVRYMSAAFYFDDELRVVESVQKPIPGYPEIVGLQTGDVAVGGTLLEADPKGRTIVRQLLLNLRKNDIRTEQIVFDAAYQATFRCGGITVLFGGEKEAEERCKDLAGILKKAGNASGILDIRKRASNGTYALQAQNP